MQIESLATLKAAFEEWRGRRRHARVAVPAALLEGAREAARLDDVRSDRVHPRSPSSSRVYQRLQHDGETY